MTEHRTVRARLAPLPGGALSGMGEEFGSLIYLWFDLDGPHFGPLPATAPGATHLWGWDTRTALLARLERSIVVAGAALHSVGPTEPGVWVLVRPLVTWTPKQHPIGEFPQALTGTRLVTLELDGPLELLADHRWATTTP